jgi:hypothetical protein
MMTAISRPDGEMDHPPNFRPACTLERGHSGRVPGFGGVARLRKDGHGLMMKRYPERTVKCIIRRSSLQHALWKEAILEVFHTGTPHKFMAGPLETSFCLATSTEYRKTTTGLFLASKV